MRKMRGIKTYLAGAFCPFVNGEWEYLDWRDFVEEKLNNSLIKLHDPRYKSNQLCPASFTMDDAQGVLDSDVLLHFRTKGYEDEGASWEQGIAFASNLYKQRGFNIKGKLIIYADDTFVPFPLHFGSANVVFNKLETSIEFLNNLKSLEKKDWIGIYMNLLDKERIGDNS